MKNYLRRITIVLFVGFAFLLATDKIINTMFLTPVEFPVEKSEVESLLEKYETEWRICSEVNIEQRQQFIIKTDNPREFKEKLNQYDYNSDTIGSIYIYRDENNTMIEFMLTTGGQDISRDIKIKAAKICRDLYGYDRVDPIVNYVLKLEKTGFVGENSKKFAGHYVVVKNSDKDSGNRWELCITENRYIRIA